MDAVEAWQVPEANLWLEMMTANLRKVAGLRYQIRQRLVGVVAFRPWLLEAGRKRNNVNFDEIDSLEETDLFT